MAAPTFTSISADLRKGLAAMAPLYILHGAEGFFIDRLTEGFLALVPEEDRDFDLQVFYGTQQLDVNAVTEACRRYPFMGDRQVVILKEAQSMRADQLDRLAAYVAAPQPMTVFLICFRGSEPKGRKLMEAAKTTALIFEAKRLKDREVGPLIGDFAKERGLRLEPKAQMMLRECLGTDLAKIHSAVAKLALVLPAGAAITPEAVEEHIGFSKDYNNFELTDAVASRNGRKAFDIITYFRANPKANPTVMVSAALFTLFSNLLAMQYAADRSPEGLMRALGLRNAWQLKNYETAARNYNASQTVEIISLLRRFDSATKGIGSRQNEYDLLHDLLYRIFTARGNVQV